MPTDFPEPEKPEIVSEGSWWEEMQREWRAETRGNGGGVTAAQVLGFGALVAGGVTLVIAFIVMALLIGPLVFWFAWNVLDFGPAVGLPELGFWAIILATLFLTFGWFGKVVITGFVFLIDPGWFQASAEMMWPEPRMRNFVAVALLSILAARPHARAKKSQRKAKRA